MIQAKVLESITLTNIVGHVANIGYANGVSRFRVGGLHPRLWVKIGVFWVPGVGGLFPPAAQYGWATFLQAAYSAGGTDETGGSVTTPIDPPLWGSEKTPLSLVAELTNDGTTLGAVVTQIGNPNTTPLTTRYARVTVGKALELQSAASEVEFGVCVQAAQLAASVGGKWKGFASCYPAGPMSECEWQELSARFRYTAVPTIINLENTAD